MLKDDKINHALNGTAAAIATIEIKHVIHVFRRYSKKTPELNKTTKNPSTNNKIRKFQCNENTEHNHEEQFC